MTFRRLYEYADCKICGQGLIGFYKEIQSGRIYLGCDDCESVWAEPDAPLEKPAEESSYGKSEPAKFQEIKEAGWTGKVRNPPSRDFPEE